MPKIKDLPRFKRPREKLEEQGPSSLKDKELLAILLRTGYAGKSALEIANRLISTFSLDRLSKLSFKDLSKIKGVGKSRAATIIAAFELGRRLKKNRKRVLISSPEDVAKVVNFLRNKKREYLVGLYLNSQNELISTEIISVGTVNFSVVHPREVFYPAIKHKAVSVIIVHNHPSGSLDISEEDVSITRKLMGAGKIIGIDLLDHIIISNHGWVSLKTKALL